MVEKNNKPIKVIFFDIGGVLLHIHPEKMIKQISTITSIPFDIVKRSFPEDAHDSYEKGKMTDNGWFQSCKNSLPTNNNLKENQFWEAWSMLLGDETDVIDILIRLKKSYKIWLLSNTNSRHIKKEIENNYVFPKLVDGAIYSYDVGHRKPEQKIYQVACERAEIEPERCVFIDDLKDNISGAINSGLNSIHYNNTTQLKKDLKIMSLIND
jgi:putative hydrolase of the HAD superfamily